MWNISLPISKAETNGFSCQNRTTQNRTFQLIEKYHTTQNRTFKLIEKYRATQNRTFQLIEKITGQNDFEKSSFGSALRLHRQVVSTG